MSSGTSTDGIRLKPDITDDVRPKPDTADVPDRGVRLDADRSASVRLHAAPVDGGLLPWQFFVLTALACATAATFLARGQGAVAIVLLTVMMAATALVGMAALRSVLPLVTAQEDRTPMIGRRTRAALEREKMLALRSIKELEFDRAMGKLSDSDWQEMSTRLRARATRLIRQLDAGDSYRDRIERELAQRLGSAVAADTAAAAPRTCSACGTAGDADARFCKNCGSKL